MNNITKVHKVTQNESFNVFYLDRVGAGIMYRSDNTVGVNLQYYIQPNFNIGYAYDYTTNKIRTVSSGSHEIIIGYDLIFGDFKNKNYSPRHF